MPIEVSKPTFRKLTPEKASAQTPEWMKESTAALEHALKVRGWVENVLDNPVRGDDDEFVDQVRPEFERAVLSGDFERAYWLAYYEGFLVATDLAETSLAARTGTPPGHIGD